MGKQVASAVGNAVVTLADGTKQDVRVGHAYVFTDAEYANMDAVTKTALGSTTTVADPNRGAVAGQITPTQLPATTTANRPSAVGRAGQTIYDLTLGLPVYSNGTVWKNAAGTTV